MTFFRQQAGQPQQNVTRVREFYEAATTRDVAKASTLLDPQLRWIEPNVPGLWFSGEHHGLENVLKEVIQPSFEKIDGFQIDLDDVLGAGDHVVATGHFRGRGKTNGVELDAPFAHVWDLRDGKAVRFEDYTDTANWLERVS